MSGAIFISYRRDDTEGEAGRLYDDLVRTFREPSSVFMDVSDIHPGKDFRKAIDDNVAKCGVLLAVIGPGWTTIKDGSGERRLDQPNDFVRLEIASALSRGIDVIPVLVHGARMPASAELPDNLQDLAYRNCVELTHMRWNSDVEVLARALREYVYGGADLPTRTIRRAIGGDATTTEPIPLVNHGGSDALNPVRETAEIAPEQATKKFKPWIVTVASGAAILVIAGLVLYHYSADSNHASQAANTAAGSASAQAGATGSAAIQEYLARLSGTWTNPQLQNGKPVRVQIGSQGNQASIRLWTRCGAAECDMGSKVLALHGDGITVDWPGQFSNMNSEQIITQTISLRIYRIGPNLHMIYGSMAGSTGWDLTRMQ